MAKIIRKVAKIFGSSSGALEVSEFGSLAAGLPVYSTDPAVIQSLAQWLEGWFSAVVGANSPAIEDMNAFCYVMAYQISYLMQAGVAEWDATTTYYIGSMVNDGGALYISKTDDNLNNVLTDTANWQPYLAGIRSLTASATLALTDDIVRCDATAGDITVTLPAAATALGKRFTIKATNIDDHLTWVKGDGSELIDFDNMYQGLSTGESLTVFCNGTSWDVI